MAPESRDEGAPAREFRIQGLALFVSGGALLALLVLAFWAGRWFERQVSPAPLGGSREEAGNAAREEPRADDLTFFDTLGGPQGAAEPQREARAKASPAEPSPAEAAAPPVRGGPYFVQVFAGRDRGAAEEIVRTLRGHGYPVTVEGEREGRGALFKVRVGGYRDRAEAQAAADRLKREGQAGAWVTKPE